MYSQHKANFKLTKKTTNLNNLVFFCSCQGQRWCQLDPDLAEQSLDNIACQKESGRFLIVTNLLHVTYSCIKGLIIFNKTM